MNKNININAEQLTKELGDYGLTAEEASSHLYRLAAEGLNTVALASCETDLDMAAARDALDAFLQLLNGMFSPESEEQPGE